MIEELESIFRRIIESNAAHDSAHLAQMLADVAEARCELIRQEGHDQGWMDHEEFIRGELPGYNS